MPVLEALRDCRICDCRLSPPRGCECRLSLDCNNGVDIGSCRVVVLFMFLLAGRVSWLVEYGCSCWCLCYADKSKEK